MSRGTYHTLRDLARGGELALGRDGAILMVRGDRWSTYLMLAKLLLVQAGRITDAGRLVLAVGVVR